MEKKFNDNTGGFPQSVFETKFPADYLERPRLHALLKEAVEYPLVVICAGSGYGKTHAVYSFLKEYDAHTTWVQFSERDNIATRFWESYSGQVLLHWPKVGVSFKEIGFPKTEEAFAKYSVIRREIATQPGKHIMVFDDFHLLYNPAILRFFEQVVNTYPSNMTIILISRTMPEINMIGLMMRGNMFTIQEDVLRFTKDEIAKYCSQLKLQVTEEDIRHVYDDTQGWAFAVNLIGRSLTKKQKYERYALEAMKKNIFRLIDEEISETVSKPLLRFLMRISLIDHLAAGLIKELASASKGDELIREMELLNAYIRYDFIMDTYMIHHLFLDYLRQKQEQILTDEERRETYQAAGVWCEENGYHTDTLSYYEKSGDYDAITRKIASLNLQLPYDTAQYAMGIFDRMPDEAKSRIPLFPAMYIKLKFNLGQFDEAQVFAEQSVKHYEARPETPERNRALASIYAFWGLLRMKLCTYTDVYDFDAYFIKMAEYFNRNPFKIIGAYKFMSITSRASLVGTSRYGAMEEYIGAISRAGPYLSHVLNGFHDGFEDLVRGELRFYHMEFNDAEQYLKQSIDKARISDQYVTQNRALVYLMHIDISRGDFASATAKLKEMEALLSKKDYGARYTMYDIAYSFYQLALEQPEQISEWLKGDFLPYTHPSFLENYANRARVRYHYQTHKYTELLAFIESTMENQSILLDKIELKVMQALSLNQLKRRGEAIAAFTEAYYLAESNKILAAFVQFAKDMRTFSAAILKDTAINGETCPIPRRWLEDINHKSSAFTKRKAKIISDYRLYNHLEDKIKLTARETAILKDLSDGRSRAEIASSRNTSVSTVKMVINAIYEKLYAASLPEAIRAAVDRKII